MSLFVLLSSCGYSNKNIEYTQIVKLYEHTQDYQGDTLWIKGKVEKSTSVFGYNGFLLNDGTKKVFVHNADKSPSSGDFIKVKGVVNVPLRLGDNSFIVIKSVEIK